MGIGELLGILGTFTALFLWSRSESRADCRRVEDLISSIQREIREEMKDFHGRLCAIESNRKILEKLGKE